MDNSTLGQKLIDTYSQKATPVPNEEELAKLIGPTQAQPQEKDAGILEALLKLLGLTGGDMPPVDRHQQAGLNDLASYHQHEQALGRPTHGIPVFDEGKDIYLDPNQDKLLKALIAAFGPGVKTKVE